MTRRHRRWHRRAWVLLAPLILLVAILGVLRRRPPATQDDAPGAHPPSPTAEVVP
jgi:hypothetical protein